MAGRFYDTAVWKRMRVTHLQIEPYCRRHKEMGQIVRGRNVDHIVPIEEGGDERDPGNLQTLCDTCHAQKTRTENQGQGAARNWFDENGFPINANHHWNTPKK